MTPAGPPHFDLIVVGLGAMGAAVSYQAALRNLRVVGIDRHSPPHTFGSTHAETRITRLAVGEGEQYLPFVARSHELWNEIGNAYGHQLLHASGGYIVTDPVTRGDRWNDFVTETANVAAAADIPYVIQQPAEFQARFPHIHLPDDVRIGFEPSAGLVMCEDAVAAQLRLAETAGATIRRNEAVVAISPDDQGVTVETEVGTVRGDQLVLATGAWMHELAAPAHRDQVTVTRQVVYWFAAEDLDMFGTDRHPFVMWVGEADSDYMALFPRPPGTAPGVKVLTEQFVETTTPDTVNRDISDAEVARFHERHIAAKYDGITAECIKREVCLYTNTPDDHFLIERDPRSDRIIVVSACSGHGFKHSAALGEAVAETLATGSSTLDLQPFGLTV